MRSDDRNRGRTFVYNFMRDSAKDNGAACFRDTDHIAERSGTSRRQAMVHINKLERERALVMAGRQLGLVCYVPLDPDPRRRSLLLEAADRLRIPSHVAGRVVFLYGRGLKISDISQRSGVSQPDVRTILDAVRSVGYMI